MTDEELDRALKASGLKIGPAAVRTDGVLLFQINDVFMFRRDVVDLVTGGATLGQILERNRGKVFPDAPTP